VLCGLSGRISISQLRVVVAAAFERFDKNSDGIISAEELAAAAAVLGLELDKADAETLHRFFSPTESMVIRQDTIADSRPIWEKWAEAAQSSVEQIAERYGLTSMSQFAGHMWDALQEPGSLEERMQRTGRVACEGAELLADSAEFAVNSAGLLLAAQYMSDTIQDAQNLTSVDNSSLDPLLMFVGVSMVSLAKELDEVVLKQMSGDEALLYAQVFHSNGVSQAEYRRLLGCQGCRWATAAPGAVLQDSTGQTLRIIVRGNATVSADDVGNADVALRPGTILGGTEFLCGKSLWESEVVAAVDEVTYIEWDATRLQECLEHHEDLARRVQKVLAAKLVDNLRAVDRLRELRGVPLTPTHAAAAVAGEQSAELVAGDSPPAGGGIQRLQPAAFVHLWPKDAAVVRQRDLCLLMGHIDAMLGLRREGAGDCARLFSYLDIHGEGEVDVDNARSRLCYLEKCIQRLEGTTVPEIMSELRGGGHVSSVMNFEDFSMAAKGLEALAGMSSQELSTLFSYLDENGDGTIDLGEWTLGTEENSSVWLQTLQTALHLQAQRKGLSRFWYLVNQVHEVLVSPGDPGKKAQQVLAKIWDGTDQIADFKEALTDATGACAAVYGIWQEISGSVVDGGVDGLNLAPFVIFLGMCAVKSMGEAAKGQVSDLSSEEAAAYEQAFNLENFSVSEFQRLLRYGEHRWEKLKPGETISTHEADGCLRMIASGSCQVRGVGELGPGQFLNEQALVGAGDMQWAASGLTEVQAVEETSILVLEVPKLEEYLQRDRKLQGKVQHMVTLSLADRLLRSHRRGALALQRRPTFAGACRGTPRREDGCATEEPRVQRPAPEQTPPTAAGVVNKQGPCADCAWPAQDAACMQACHLGVHVPRVALLA